MVGKSLAHYEVLEPLGKGGMGEVYRARDPRLDREVAIKLLPAAVARDSERLARLQREAKALAALNHPNIATIHDLDEDGETTFIVMELLEGESLADRIRERPLDSVDALGIARQIARALEAAHERGIVHRDLKPENIAVSPDGHVKVLDFGLAKQLQEGPAAPDPDTVSRTRTAELTEAGAVMGTPAYMSPEQLRAEPIDARADVWAFGCVLYELLTGRRAFARETMSDTMAAVLTEQPREDWFPADVPESVRQLVRGALIKDREHRLSSMHDARVSLEQLLTGTVSGPAAAPSRTPGTWGGALAAMVGAVLVIAAAWYLIGGGAPGDAGAFNDRTIAVLPFETLGQAEPTAFTEGVHVDMLTRLSHIPDLRVTSRTSVMRYRTTDRRLPEIAEELGVRWVLLAEVQEAGGEVQVNARLVNAVDDEQVWAQTYRRELTAENLFDIQGELAQQIGAELRARLTPRQRELTAEAPTRDLEAYRLYVQGRALLNRRTSQDMRAAVEYFRQAVERDPEYAMAWVGIADAHALLESYQHAPDEDLITPGFEAVDRALELAPDLAEAHASRSLLLAESGAGASISFRELQRAVELRPSYAEAHNWMAWAYLIQGWPEQALESAQRAVELDPLSVEALSNVVLAEIAHGNYEQAIEETQALNRLSLDYETARFYEALAYLHVGDYEAASALLDGPAIPWAGEGRLTSFAVARARLGDDDAAVRALLELEQSGHPVDVAIVRAALGRDAAAWDALAEVDGWSAWPRLAAYYLFPDLLGQFRADPRWADIEPPRMELRQAP